jgi:hypothetical protein
MQYGFPHGQEVIAFLFGPPSSQSGVATASRRS